MISERLLTMVMSVQGRRQLKAHHYAEPRLPDPSPGRRYLLYVHVPFCERLCPYCSFNRYPFQERLARRYFTALREELRMLADQGYDFASLCLGGGTPTILLDELCSTIDLARELFAVERVTCETNPDHLTPRHLEALTPRVHRLSVGVQSFDDRLLMAMDRYEKYGSGAEVFGRLQRTSGLFDALNVDLIYNFPGQTEPMLLRDLSLVKECGCDQVTAYPLMASQRVKRSLAGDVGRAGHRRERRYHDLVVDALADTFQASSAWCFTRVGGGLLDEYILDHEEYVGVGPGAFSFLAGTLFVETFSLLQYDAAIGAGRTGVDSARTFSLRDQMRYRFLMELFGLRLDKSRFRTDFGVSVDRALPLEMAFLRANGAFAQDTPEELTPSRRGRYLLVVMMREFFVGVNNVRERARAALPYEERALLSGDASSAGAGRVASPVVGHGLDGAPDVAARGAGR